MATRTRTNTAFVSYVMTHCPTGALGQAFVIEAIRRYAEQIADLDPAVIGNALFSGEAWKQTAEFILAEYDQNYGGRR